MNKFAVSLGLLALGTTAVHAVEATVLSGPQRTKPWTVAASLRGFYDDNINASESNEVDSFGVDISPSVDFGLAGDQTSFNLGYQFSARYYDKKPAGQSDHWDYTHIFDGALAHTFSPRLSMIVRDSFVIGQEPDLLRAGDDPLSTAQRIAGNNIINNGSIAFDIEATELLGFHAAYRNAYYHYSQSGQPYPSLSGLLNRVENRVTLDSRWKFRPQTTGILGYEYGQYIYTGDEPLGNNPGDATSETKDARSHTFYGGVEHKFSPTFSATLKAGAQYYDYYGDPLGDASWSPYAQFSLGYQYQSATRVEVGASYSRSVADQVGNPSVATFIKDTEVALAYGTIRHEFLPRLVGTANGTVQYATYNGGGPGYDGESYLFFQIGLDLAYQFTPHLSAHVGYNYDDNDSDIVGQSYNRNRVYVGLTAFY